MKKRFPQLPVQWSVRVVRLCFSPLTWPLTWMLGLVAALSPTAQNSAQAQVVPTAGGAGTTVAEAGDQFDIEGGTQAGGNLFHEFEQFDLSETQTANFISDSGVFNIVGQVSEANPSYIDGTVQVSGSDANLYLINPSGVLFGPNAQLSLSGSFTAATADKIEFTGEVLNVLDNGTDYSTFTGDPSAFHFTETSASAVVNQGDLAVAAGESISLMGGNVVSAGSLSAPGGEIGLVSVGGESTVRYGIPGSLLSIEVADSAVTGGGFAVTDLPALLTGSPTPLVNSLALQADGSYKLGPIQIEAEEVSVTGEISTRATAGDGGAIALLGRSIDVVGAVIDASGDKGGNIRIGKDVDGQGNLPTSDLLLMNRTTTVRADGEDGAGGRVVVGSSTRATVQGSLSAQGTTSGGLVETSSSRLDLRNLRVDASGQADVGRWLVAQGESDIVSSASGFGQIDSSLVEATLDSGTDVEIATSVKAGGTGDISLSDSIDQNGGGSANLTLTGRRFSRNGSVIDLSSTGQLTFNLNQVNAEANPTSASIGDAIAAIGDVNGERLVTLGAGNYGFTGGVTLDTDVEIVGAGPSNTLLTTLLAGTNVFQVDAGVDATLRDVTVTTAGLGANDVGGGIVNQGTLTIDNSHFVDNRSSQNGGAIESLDGGPLVVSNSEFRDNRSAASGSGGAIHLSNSSGISRISNTLFENNNSPKSGGAVNVSNSRVIVDSGSRFVGNTATYGGAVRTSGGTFAEFDTVTFEGNSSTDRGGAIVVGGGGRAALSHNTFTENESVNGGAIAIVAAGLTDTGSTFTRNRSISGGNGGAIYTSSNGRINSTDATFTGNTAENDGGAISHNAAGQTLTLRNAIFSDNVSQADGGAVFANAGTTTIVEASQFTANRAEGATSQGGGLAIVDGAQARLTDTVVANNVSSEKGGGLYVDADGTVTVTGTLVTDTDGGAISATTRFVDNQAGRDGGGIAAIDESTLAVSGVLFRGNFSGDDGGGVSVTEVSQATIDNSNFENNRGADNGGGLYSNNILPVSPRNTQITLTNSRFIRNEAGDSGGGFYQGRQGEGLVQNTLFRDNESVLAGGGVHVAAGKLTLENSQLSANQSRLGAGLAVSSGGDVTVTGTAFTANVASSLGGGVHSDRDSQLRLSGSTFERNEAISGGGMYTSGTSEIVNSTFSGNRAQTSGGAIQSSGSASALTLRNATLTANHSQTSGGGIADSNSRLIRLQNTIVAGNTSPMSADVLGHFEDEGGNLIGRGDGATGFTNSVRVGSAANPIDPGLAPLAHNGGPSKTHAPLANSVAVDAGRNVNLPTVDQRGALRFAGSAVDIGAVELSVAEVATTPPVTGVTPPEPTLPSVTPESGGPLLEPTLSTATFLELDSLLPVRKNHDLESAEVLIRQLEQTFSQGFEDYWDLSAGPDLSFSEVQAILRRAQDEYKVNSAVVYAIFAPEEPAEGESDTILQVDPTPADDDLLNLSVVMPAGELASYQLPITRQEVIRQVRYFRSATSDPEDSRSYQPLAQQLYQWLLAPIEEDLAAQNVHNLMYALDAGLRSAPITAMRDYEGFSLERYGLSVVPSMGLMQADFPVSVRRATVAMGVSEFSSESPLPAVPIELQVVDQFVPVSQTVLNESTTLEAIKSVQALEQPGVLHLATHATFDRRSPEDSAIHLWNDSLSMREFSQLDWGASDLELLILSACSTALGSHNSELGFAGLAAASGVDATVGSLWEVSDVGALALMSEFYAQLEETDLRFEALRRAQLALLNGDTRIEGGNLITGHGEVDLPDEWNLPDTATLDHPFFWSAFTMVGNPW